MEKQEKTRPTVTCKIVVDTRNKNPTYNCKSTTKDVPLLAVIDLPIWGPFIQEKNGDLTTVLDGAEWWFCDSIEEDNKYKARCTEINKSKGCLTDIKKIGGKIIFDGYTKVPLISEEFPDDLPAILNALGKTCKEEPLVAARSRRKH